MDDSKTYMNLNFTKMESLSRSRGARKQEPKENIGNRPCWKICLLCLVTLGLIVIVAGVSIYVSQVRQSQLLWEQNQEITRIQTQCRQQIHNLNLTVESKTSGNSRLNLSDSVCVQNVSLLNRNLADICQFLNRSREQNCSKDWKRSGDRCYFFSTSETSYDGARQQCSNFDSRLLEINSTDEASFLLQVNSDRDPIFWIGKCEDGKVASQLLYTVVAGRSICGHCGAEIFYSACHRVHPFICEKPAPLFPEIPQKIQDLCLQPVELI
ncbi:C-type lectin domain family 12 member B-like isoform X2 [Mobula birostris]|uniref:C-type lectin domain family 12 member B-like isoform X2 n=1 Tax=Mobula birostris TaxID=1983395 RepID=UPI003B2894FA